MDSFTLKLPGFGLPVNYLPSEGRRFPTLVGLDSDFKANTLTNRELCMLRFIEEITNKPDWWIKVRDEAIATKWKAEALELDWGKYLKYGDFTSAMADACIEELKLKSQLYESTKLIPVYDYSAAVVKSDHLIDEDLWQALKEGVKILEDVPDEDKDWHPGSKGLVLDLVHPSLYPLVYGKSRILSDRRIGVTEALKNCGKGDVIEKPKDIKSKSKSWHCTSTNFQWLPCDVSVEEGRAKIESYINNLHPVKHSTLYPIIEKFIEKSLPAWDVIYRWPKEFAVQRLTIGRAEMRCRSRRTCASSDHGCTPLARPTRDDEPRRSAYDEKYSDSDVSDSDVSDDEVSESEEEDDDERERRRYHTFSLRRPERQINPILHDRSRKTNISESEYETEEYDSPEDAEDEQGENGDQDKGEDEDEDDDEEQERDPNHVSENEVKRRDWRWFYKTHPQVAPEPSTEPQLKIRAEDVKSGFTHGFRSETGPHRLQVIVKLANIHLSPDKPTYRGGSWHVEGQINEHICATALFYYSNENITDSYIDFRTQSNAEDLDEENLEYEQYDWKTIQRIFAINWPGGGSTMQNVGSVLTREGRALFFPNVLQHHVNSFKLADPTRPGHRKILALFLVDPCIPVISTANVPPQQKHWWPDELIKNEEEPEPTLFNPPKVELPFDDKIAKEFRRDLIAERSGAESRVEDKMKGLEWNFCEH
ncbi:hypothetical protein AK830_g1423 [Neonectria ditissima]|uniref:Uncharacterized protein n=1 Tax=Neonectria ditissima TaxID=78410 RepID=A0A0P7BJ59_9HYPO|nr:hypothetical protein AK830_g1423 [Neonectria ditissima]